MNNGISRMRRAALAGALALMAASAALAQEWPTKPLRIVVPYPPGVPGDIIARQLQPALQAALKQPVVIDNKAGAGGNIGMQDVVRSADDHTILWGVDTMFTINPHIYRKLGFKPLEVLQPLTQLAAFRQMLVRPPPAAVRTLPELVAAARGREISYASGGAGVPGHMTMEMLLAASQVRMAHVPYRGTVQAVQDIVGGQVPCGLLATPVVGPFVRQGRLVALAVSGNRRLSQYPDIPTVAEGGVKDFDATFTEMVAVHRSMSPDKVQRLHQAITAALQQPEVRSRLNTLELEVVANTPEQSAARLKTESARWAAVASRVNLQVD